MTVRTAITSQFGYAEETTYGIPVVPTRFLPLTAGGDGIKTKIPDVDSESIYAGARVLRESQVDQGVVDPQGSLGLELFDRGEALLWKHMLGAIQTTGPVSGLYTHTATPGDLAGKSLTLQPGRTESADGIVQPFTYPGSKFMSWELSWEEGKTVSLGLDVVSRDEILLRTVNDGVTASSATVTSATAAFGPDDLWSPISGAGIPADTFIGVINSATSIGLSSSPFANTPVNATGSASGVALTIGMPLASVSYPAGLLPFQFLGASVTIAGQAFKVKKGKFAGDNKLDTGRYFGGMRLREEPLEGDELREYTGQLDTEFFDLTAYKRFTTGTTAQIVATFRRGANTITITENIRFAGETPNPDGTGVIMQSIPFRALAQTVDTQAITVAIVNGDSTP